MFVVLKSAYKKAHLELLIIKYNQIGPDFIVKRSKEPFSLFQGGMYFKGYSS